MHNSDWEAGEISVDKVIQSIKGLGFKHKVAALRRVSVILIKIFSVAVPSSVVCSQNTVHIDGRKHTDRINIYSINHRMALVEEDHNDHLVSMMCACTFTIHPSVWS